MLKNHRLAHAAVVVAGALLIPFPTALAGEAGVDWQRVVELDAGPKAKPTSQQEARSVAAAHVGRQEKALRDFLAAHPTDAHAFEAEMRLARLLQIRAG